jgi:hypothetical protein
MVSTGKGTTHEPNKEFNSPNGLNVMKISRLRYTGHMIRRPEAYHKQLYSEPNPLEGEIKEDQNSGGRMG